MKKHKPVSKHGDPRLDKVEEAVKAIQNGDTSPEAYYALLVCGHRVYKQGLGLPHQVIYKAIEEGCGKKFKEQT